MLDVIAQMAGLIACGVGWRLVRPAGLAHDYTRKVLTSLVYYLLLPALVLSVMWKAQLGTNSLLIAFCAASGIGAGLLLAFFSCRFCRAKAAEAGAIILAVAFANVTYLGLAVLEATFGPWARSVAIQYDLFASTPLLFTVGILIAARFGITSPSHSAVFSDLYSIPALWAAVIAVVLNLSSVPMPFVIEGLLDLLGRGVVPLMLFSLGLSLDWNQNRWRLIPTLMPVVVLKLFVIPLLVLGVVVAVGLEGELRAAVVMEAAMPSMVIGLVICDRFNLDVGLYATAVTVTTVLSLFTLPLWYQWLT